MKSPQQSAAYEIARSQEAQQKADALIRKWEERPKGNIGLPLPIGAYQDIVQTLGEASITTTHAEAVKGILVARALLNAVVTRAQSKVIS